MTRLSVVLSMFALTTVAVAEDAMIADIEPAGEGSHKVGSTNMEVLDELFDVGDDVVGHILSGDVRQAPGGAFISDVMKHPESAWIIPVDVPDDSSMYGPVAGKTMPVSLYVTYPSAADSEPNEYAFPYQDAQFGVFEDMLAPGEAPAFADPDARYPLVVLSHGATAHGIYDVGHAHRLSSHGYIVAVLFYGDLRTVTGRENPQMGFLRPLMTRAAIDAILDSDEFGGNVQTENIGISGHSFGGFTSLALNGGQYRGNTATVHDERIKASVVAAPWVGSEGLIFNDYAFGKRNDSLSRVTVPVLSLFGTTDEVTTASTILPAMKKLSGPTYVVELVDQPHIFDGGSWVDRDNWELLFFNAYLKSDAGALEALRTGRSMQGGNDDVQLFEYQKLP